MPRLRSLSAGDGNSFAVLLDDDLRYKPWALEWLERAITDDVTSERHAYSYDVYTMTEGGRAVTGGLYPGLLVGAGHALFAIRVSKLDGIEAFFRCVHALEPRSTYHDDVVISMYLQDVHGADIYRLGGTPYEVAHKTFPEVHETTISYMSPGALIRLAHDAGNGPQAAAATSASPSRKERHSLQRWARSHPTQQAATQVQPTAQQGHQGETASSTGQKQGAPLVGALEGGAALLKNGSSVEQARQAYSRQAINLAMGQVRARILKEGLCGVRPNAPSCVGSWCQYKGTWGPHVEKVVF